MNPIRHDITFAYIVFIGLLFLFFSPRYSWVEIPGAIALAEIDRKAQRDDVAIPELNEFGRKTLEKVYQDRRYWETAQWPYG